MLHPDSISHSSHNVAVGRATSRACNLDQSIPSTSAASCEALSRISPPITGGHLKFPFSSRFQNSTSPDPSQAKIFKRSARLQRKTKIVPENGSCPSCSRTSAANPSAPLRKSTGLVAIRTRIPAATVIVPQPVQINSTLRMDHGTGDLDSYRAAAVSLVVRQRAHGRHNRDKHRHGIAGQNQSSATCRLAPSKQMLGTHLVLPRHFAHNRTRRVRFRHDPALLLVTPTAAPAHPYANINTAVPIGSVNYMVNHICEPL